MPELWRLPLRADKELQFFRSDTASTASCDWFKIHGRGRPSVQGTIRGVLSFHVRIIFALHSPLLKRSSPLLNMLQYKGRIGGNFNFTDAATDKSGESSPNHYHDHLLVWLTSFSLCHSNRSLVISKLTWLIACYRKYSKPDKTSGLSFDTAMYPHEYKNLHGKPRWANKMNRKRERKCIQSDQPAWNPGGASATP
jgi:hypothetical protein